jgi:hypothetical protein
MTMCCWGQSIVFKTRIGLSMPNYRVTIFADVESSLLREDLESRLVVSLYDIETEGKVSDGQSEQLEVIDYELTEAMPIEE